MQVWTKATFLNWTVSGSLLQPYCPGTTPAPVCTQLDALPRLFEVGKSSFAC
jgi:hypothetical protein